MLANLPGGPAIRRDLDAICVRSVSLLWHQVGPLALRRNAIGSEPAASN
jgi:hypothetical protein